jgi:hypothetical protein
MKKKKLTFSVKAFGVPAPGELFPFSVFFTYFDIAGTFARWPIFQPKKNSKQAPKIAFVAGKN